MENEELISNQGTFLIDNSSVQAISNECCFSDTFSFLRHGLGFISKLLAKLWEFYIILNTNAISAVLLLILIIGMNIALFFIAVLTHPVQVDYSLNAFEVHDKKIAQPFDSLLAAKMDVMKSRQEEEAMKKHRIIRATNPELVLHTQYKQKWKLDIIYVAKDGNVFSAEKLDFIHKVEKNLMHQPKFKDFCWKTTNALHDYLLNKTFNGCMPPNSLIDFFYRTDRFDGQGRELSDISETLDYLLTKVSTFWYVDEEFSADKRRSKMLRSQLHFGIPLKGFTESEQSIKQQHAIFKDFLMKYVEQLGKASSDQITVLYGSPEIYDYEVKSTFRHDVLLATVSFGLIFVLVFVLSSFSFWLTLTGVLTIIFSLPLAYFCYRVLLDIESIGILTGTTVFVIIGIGVDDVFVFINIFKQATHLKDQRQQMKHCILTAGKATFFTSFTTAAAFGANILSEVPAVHDFGLFTCILVMTCWLMVLLLMPPSLFLWKKWLVKCETCLCFKKCRKHLHTDIQEDNLLENDVLDEHLRSTQVFEMMAEGTDKEVRTGKPLPKCCTVTNLLSIFLEKFVAKPFTKGRYVVLILYLGITAGSIGAITHLKTASGRPELFAKDSNIQRLLNLKTNLSSEAIDCSSCSEVLAEVHPGVSRQEYNQRNFQGIAPLFRRSIQDGQQGSNATQPKDLKHGTEISSSQDEGNFSHGRYDYNTPLGNSTSENAVLFRDKSSLQNASVSAWQGSLENRTTRSEKKGNGMSSTTATKIASAEMSSPTRNPDGIRNASEHSSLFPESIHTTKFTIHNATISSSTMLPITTGNHDNDNTTLFTTKQATTRNMSKSQTVIKPRSKSPTVQTIRSATSTTRVIPRRPGSKSTETVSTVFKKMTKMASRTSTPMKQNTNNPELVTAASPSIVKTNPPLCPKPCTPVKRPSLDINALVFLVFGIKGLDRSTANHKHVVGEMGTPIYDDRFTLSGKQLSVVASGSLVKALCKICYKFQTNTDLVLPGGADCFPRDIYRQLKLFAYDECQNLTEPNYANGRISLSMIGVIRGEIKWMAMTFESTIFTGKSAFLVKQDYKRWENFTRTVLSGADIPDSLKGGYQTSNAWVDMFSEIIAVNGAIYGTTLSLVMCLAAVVIFTANFMLSFIVFITIIGALALVVGIFYFAGWQLGAIEAISLSILVGTSVDYTVHLIEGYIMAGKITDFDSMKKKDIRFERVRLALSHIGVSIFSSAVTTIIAAIPLCLTSIRLFSKFGEILAINTTMSILYTLTICVSLLSIMGPTRFQASFRSHFFAFIATTFVIGLTILVMYLASYYGNVDIPSPSGGKLFH